MSDAAAIAAGRRSWIWSLVATFAGWGAISSFLGALAPDVQAAFGLSDAAYGAVVGVQALGALAGGLLGAAARGFGSVRTRLAAALTAAAVGLAAAATAPTAVVLTAALFFVVFAMVVATTLGHGAAGRLASTPGAVSEVAAVETAFAAGAAVGPATVLLLLALFADWRAPYAVGAGLLALIAVATLRLPSLAAAGASAAAHDPTTDRLPGRFLALLLLVGVLGAVVEMVHLAWAVLHAVRVAGVEADEGRLVLTLALSCMLISRAGLAPLARRVAPERLLIASAATSLIGFAILTLGSGRSALYGGNVAIGLAMGVYFPATLMAGMARFPNRGNALAGTMVVGEGVGVALGGLAVGAAAELVGLRAAYGVFVATAAVWIFALAALFRAAPRRGA